MPKDNKRLREQEKLTPEEIAARKDEKFRTFFSTSVAQVPEEMNRRMEQQEEEASTPTHGLLGKLFRRDKDESEDKTDPDDTPKEMPTGEISLDGDTDEPESDLQLAVPADEWEKFNTPEKPDDEPEDADFDMELPPPRNAPSRKLRPHRARPSRWKRERIRRCRN